MQKKRILFRTSGGKIKGKQMGLGHVMRCMNLAKVLTKSFNIEFLIEDYGGVKSILKENHFHNITQIKRKGNVTQDTIETLKLINKKSIDLIIIDKHDLETSYIKKIKENSKIVIITDLKKYNFRGDLIVNGFIGLKNKKFQNRFNATCLTGPKYQILNSKFGKQSKIKKQYSILATFGGLDEKGVRDIFLKASLPYIKKNKLELIVGPMAKKSSCITKIQKRYPKNIKVKNMVKNMHAEISKAQFGFTLGGITTYEFAACNVPFAIISDDKHQLPTAKEWEKRKLGINLGMISIHTEKKIQKILEEITHKRFHNFTKAKNFVDGLGVNRVAHEILKISNS